MKDEKERDGKQASEKEKEIIVREWNWEMHDPRLKLTKFLFLIESWLAEMGAKGYLFVWTRVTNADKAKRGDAEREAVIKKVRKGFVWPRSGVYDYFLYCIRD